MKNTSVRLNSSMETYRGKMIFVLVLILALVIPGQVALAQDGHGMENADAMHKAAMDAKQYLMDKYKIRKHDMTSTVRQRPHGLTRYLNMRGNIKPKNVVITEDTIQGRARAMAKAFLEEEADLLGITNMDEIRESWIDTSEMDDGGNITRIRYFRYINNLQLSGVYIQIKIGLDETITSVNAEFAPVPPELYEAAAKETITKGEALEVIRKDLKSNGIDSENIRIADAIKAAVLWSPYVVWGVDLNVVDATGAGGRWQYNINAFTGEIIGKRDAVIIN